jgi:hypothetical protein
MGLFRQYRRGALTRVTSPNLERLFAFSCLVFLSIGAIAQTTSSATDDPLPACVCSDVPRLQDRLQKLKGALLLVANQVQSTSAAKPATRQKWIALQSQIHGYLRALEIQGLTTFPDASLFAGNADPFCGNQMISGGACLDQDFAVHQQEHDASCRAGNWSWQNSWSEPAMLDEEGGALAKEVQAIQETIKHLGCGVQPAGTTGGGAPSTHPNQPAGVCPQFTVVVQNVTQASVNLPGALMAQSGRSLNNGQGIWIPLTFHSDGTFEGFGSGADSGTAAGTAPGETVHSQFGHMQSIAASGFIRAGNCATQPCQPDVMHLVLAGGPSQQVAQAQARGALNRDLSETTATSGAIVIFDLPAYTGGSAQKTFMSSPLMSSYMTVSLAQGNNGTPALPAGSSMLYALQQCAGGATVGPRPTGGGGVAGGAGIIVPGLETAPTGGKESAADIAVNISEPIHVGDSVSPGNGVFVAIEETIHTSDQAAPQSSVIVAVKETVHISDGSPAFSTPAIVVVTEAIHTMDKPQASAH